MTLEKLNDLIAGGEGDRQEYKETTGQRVEACRTLCAFLNGDGGTVVFGVSRKGKLTGQLVSDETKKDLARAFCDFEPGIEIPTEYVDVDESHQVIICHVEGGAQKPYAYEGRPYQRFQAPQSLRRGVRTLPRGGVGGFRRRAREVIVNALAHRFYTSNGLASMAIREDRVEISTPGNFNLEIAAQGAFPGMASTPRNPTIAKVHYLRKAIEMWGIVNACEKARIAAPNILVLGYISAMNMFTSCKT